MRFVLTQLLAVHWLLTFALVSAAALGADGSLAEILHTIMPSAVGYLSISSPPHQAILAGCVAIASATVAAMFLWALLMIWMGEGEDPAEAHSVMVLAHASAMTAVSGLMVLMAGAGAGGSVLAASVIVAALSASFAAMTYEWRGQELTGEKPDLGLAAARRMALGAAHSTVLSSISGRGRND